MFLEVHKVDLIEIGILGLGVFAVGICCCENVPAMNVLATAFVLPLCTCRQEVY